MKKIFAAMVAALLMVSLASSAAVASDKHGNVGTIYGVTSAFIYDALGNTVNYTCGSVHRTAVPGGWQDKQSCVLDPASALPAKSMSVSETFPGVLTTALGFSYGTQCSYDTANGLVTGAPTVGYSNYSGEFYNKSIWYSDYTYMLNGSYQTALSWTYKISPSGALSVVSFYPTIAIPDPCFG